MGFPHDLLAYTCHRSIVEDTNSMDSTQFETLVREALDDLPEDIARYLDNIDVVIAAVPSRTQLARAGVRPHHTLLGLYEGVPRTRRSSRYNLQVPDKITLFQRPIERICNSDEEIRRQVRQTLLHEIAHYFGFNEAEIRALEREMERDMHEST